MKIVRMIMVVLVSMLAVSSSVSAQVLVTGETGGKGNQAVLFSANGIFPEGLELVSVYGQYIYGVTDRLDFGPVYGHITALGRTQHYIGTGWNLALFRRKKAFVDVSFFGVATFPLNKRSEASTVLTAPSLVVSRPITLNGKSVSLYTGVSTLVPIGQTLDTLFTPPETVWNVPLGFSTVLNDGWSLYAEVDVHPTFKAVGIGLVKGF
ncbi:MAG: hypothetical protein A3J46_06760 [Candidatus Yanofskybacteria bacterium RIFCSPHIGHO2_02_FULL_41_11]|uniref:Outer membrane protein beta-barrel domain-containing protein n=1 Tax=Candidatus Yanofskybacteria bacterium RIFCSPHIGHO2_02_FULL_41_11 TaxID=1802675 RepID=A0A1F8F5H7_9BACT|nr:MAG: hypothetical protein A3J46_06760 [Candidatus Yanofskybacteria bacterium RIFCSPHIGHO2_02_FULL_41_11]